MQNHAEIAVFETSLVLSLLEEDRRLTAEVEALEAKLIEKKVNIAALETQHAARDAELAALQVERQWCKNELQSLEKMQKPENVVRITLLLDLDKGQDER